MQPVKISIITPSFNRGYIVQETAESIFNQTYRDWEWVIVDDGSTDDSWEILRSFAEKDSRVKIYKRDREPKGACTCRNIAVEKCTGDYVMFLDTDDVLAPYCLEQRAMAVSEEPECDFVIFPMLLFKKEPGDLNLLWNVDKPENELSRQLKGDAICQGTGPLWKKISFKKVGMWNEELKLWQDVELHIRSFLYPVKYKKRLDLRPDVYLRISEDSLSRVGYHAAPKLKSRVKVYIYALEEITKRGLLHQYSEGLRIMGIDVIVSLIKGRLHKEAGKLIGTSSDYGVFDKSEAKQIKHYMYASMVRLYKIPALFKYVNTKVTSMVAEPDVTIGKIKFGESLK